MGPINDHIRGRGSASYSRFRLSRPRRQPAVRDYLPIFCNELRLLPHLGNELAEFRWDRTLPC